MSNTGLYIGARHSNGGIPVLVNRNHWVETEGGEYLICREAYFSDEKLLYKQKTNLEVLNSIHNEFSCKFDKNKAWTGDFVLCRHVINDEKKYDRYGTVQEILNQMQGENGCRVEFHFKEDEEYFEEGGQIISKIEAPKFDWAGLANPVTKEEILAEINIDFKNKKILYTLNKRMSRDLVEHRLGKKLSKYIPAQALFNDEVITVLLREPSGTVTLNEVKEEKNQAPNKVRYIVQKKPIIRLSVYEAADLIAKVFEEYRKEEIIDHIDDVLLDFNKLIKRGDITPELAIKIIESAGGTVPENIIQLHEYEKDRKEALDNVKQLSEGGSVDVVAAALKSLSENDPDTYRKLVSIKEREEELPYQDFSNIPDVNFNRRDLQDNVKTGFGVNQKTIRADYSGGEKDLVYEGYIPVDEIPAPELIEDTDSDSGEYDWSELNGRQKNIPPAKIKIMQDGEIKILDGNHRITSWIDSGYDYIPAWIIDQRTTTPDALAIAYREAKEDDSDPELVEAIEKVIPSFENGGSIKTYNGIVVPKKINPRYIVSAFQNEMDWSKVEEFTNIMREEMLSNEFPPVDGFPHIIDEGDVESGREFLSGNPITEGDIGRLAWCVTNGHHRSMAAINASLPYLETVLDYSTITDEKELEKAIAIDKANGVKLEKGGEILFAPNGKRSNLTSKQYKLVRTPEFINFFGDWLNGDPSEASKVVDENGEPLVLYHISRSEKRFSVFKTDKQLGSHFGTKNQIETIAKSKIDNINKNKLYEVFLNIRNPVRAIDTGYFTGSSLADALLNRFPTLKEETHEVHEIESNIFRGDSTGKSNVEVAVDAAIKLARSYDVDGIVYLNRFESNSDKLKSTDDEIDILSDEEVLEIDPSFEDSYIVFKSNQIKLADGSNTTFDSHSPDIRLKKGGRVKLNYEEIISSPRFKEWFGDSKIVDSQGKPQIYYHGTAKRFNKFSPNKSAMAGVFWFSNDKGKIERGEAGASYNGAIIPVFIVAHKVAGWDEYEKLGLGQIEEMGYDAIKLDDDLIVFNPEQIKLADGSNTTFNPKNKDIRYDDGGEISEEDFYSSFPTEAGRELARRFHMYERRNEELGEVNDFRQKSIDKENIEKQQAYEEHTNKILANHRSAKERRAFKTRGECVTAKRKDIVELEEYDHMEAVEKAINNCTYQKAIADGLVSVERVKEIIESAGLIVPEDISTPKLVSGGNIRANQKPAVEFDKKYGTNISQQWDLGKLQNGLTSDKLWSLFDRYNPLSKNKAKRNKLADKLNYEIFPYNGINKLTLEAKLDILAGMASEFNFDDIVFLSIDGNWANGAKAKEVRRVLGEYGVNDIEFAMSPATLKKILPHLKKRMQGRKLEKGGAIDETTPEELEQRWDKKKTAIEILANNVSSLRNNITRTLNSKDVEEKEFLTALAIAVILQTAERVGNEVSRENGHKGVTGFCKNNISISGNKVSLSYRGKSGVDHEKSFSDALIAKALKKAIKKSPTKFIFCTSDKFRIKPDRINRFLGEAYDLSAKDLRGYLSNQWIIEKLNKLDVIEVDEAKRKRQFLKILREVAKKVGHGAATLRKHYMLPELESEFIGKGNIIELKDFYSEGGGVKLEKGGIVERFAAPDTLLEQTIKLEGGGNIFQKFDIRLAKGGEISQTIPDIICNIELMDNSSPLGRQIDVWKSNADGTKEVLFSINDTDNTDPNNEYNRLQIEKYLFGAMMEKIENNEFVPKEDVDFFLSDESIMNSNYGMERLNNKLKTYIPQKNSLLENGGSIDSHYPKWKRNNVTYRGMKEIGQHNQRSGMLGKGLYTTPAGNKSMTKEYGERYFVVNGRPKNPKVFGDLNQWEIWFQNNLVFPYSLALGKKMPDRRDFDKKTTIEAEMQKLGYDGVEIKGREIVNYAPEDVKYFRTEQELKNYFNSSQQKLAAGGSINQRFVSIAPPGTVFVIIGSHRAFNYFERMNIPYISFWSMGGGGTAATYRVLINEKDYPEVATIQQGRSISKPLDKLYSKGMSWSPNSGRTKEEEILFDAYVEANKEASKKEEEIILASAKRESIQDRINALLDIMALEEDQTIYDSANERVQALIDILEMEPGKDTETNEEKLLKELNQKIKSGELSDGEGKLLRMAIEKIPNIKLNNVINLGNTIAKMDKSESRKLEHTAEALYYEDSKVEPNFGRVDIEHFEHTIKGHAYTGNLNRMQELGILSKEGQEDLRLLADFNKKRSALALDTNSDKFLQKYLDLQVIGISPKEALAKQAMIEAISLLDDIKTNLGTTKSPNKMQVVADQISIHSMKRENTLA